MATTATSSRGFDAPRTPQIAAIVTDGGWDRVVADGDTSPAEIDELAEQLVADALEGYLGTLAPYSRGRCLAIAHVDEDGDVRIHDLRALAALGRLLEALEVAS